MSNDWSTDDLHYRKCLPSELELFAKMCVAAKFLDIGQGALTEEQLESVIEVGVSHGIPREKCGRFFRRVCDIAERRKLSMKSLATFWNGMQSDIYEKEITQDNPSPQNE